MLKKKKLQYLHKLTSHAYQITLKLLICLTRNKKKKVFPLDFVFYGDKFLKLVHMHIRGTNVSTREKRGMCLYFGHIDQSVHSRNWKARYVCHVQSSAYMRIFSCSIHYYTSDWRSSGISRYIYIYIWTPAGKIPTITHRTSLCTCVLRESILHNKCIYSFQLWIPCPIAYIGLVLHTPYSVSVYAFHQKCRYIFWYFPSKGATKIVNEGRFHSFQMHDDNTYCCHHWACD